MGTIDDKQSLAADILKVDSKSIKSFMTTSVNPVPCVYLFNLGKVKQLRDIFDIPSTFGDDENVVKYGLTNNLKRRSSEHERTYGTMINGSSELILKYHVYIDEKNLLDAEHEIADYFTESKMMLNHKKFNEIACVPDCFLNTDVYRKYIEIGCTYGEKIRDVQKELEYSHKLNKEIMDNRKTMIENNKILIQKMEDHHKLINEKNEQLLEANFREIELYKRILDKSLYIIAIFYHSYHSSHLFLEFVLL